MSWEGVSGWLWPCLNVPLAVCAFWCVVSERWGDPVLRRKRPAHDPVACVHMCAARMRTCVHPSISVYLALGSVVNGSAGENMKSQRPPSLGLWDRDE